VSFSPDGKRIAGGGISVGAQLWDASTFEEGARCQAGWVLGAAFSPDSKQLVTGSDGVMVWDVATGMQVRLLKGHTDQVTSVAWSPDGKRIASSARDNTVKVWDAVSGELSFSLDQSVNSVAFSPDSKHVVTGSAHNSVDVWDAATGQNTFTVKAHGGVTGVAFSADGKRIVSGGYDKVLRIWDFEKSPVGDPKPLVTLAGHTHWIKSVAISPDGKRIASGGDDHTARVWDTESGQNTLTIKGHTSVVTSVAFSPDGKRIASASLDGTVKVWDASMRQTK
jgi:WD40 repeat protein